MQKTYEIGNKYGMLTIVEERGRHQKGHVKYLCKCDCGTVKEFAIHHIRVGDTKSCGCRKKFLTQNRRGNIPVFVNNSIEYLSPLEFNEEIHTRATIYDSVLREEGRRETWKGYGEIPKRFWNQIVASSKSKQRKKDMEFEITIEYIWDLFLKQNRKCALSGLDLTIPYYINPKRISVGNASLDRMDSGVGYTLKNVQWVHKDINIMKNVYTQDRFLELCKLITENASKNLSAECQSSIT